MECELIILDLVACCSTRTGIIEPPQHVGATSFYCKTHQCLVDGANRYEAHSLCSRVADPRPIWAVEEHEKKVEESL
jgi:hypothetical protein